MSPEAQRIEIAEACGWKEIKPCTCKEQPTGLSPFTNTKGNHLPDYLNDLNAMHEAEKVLLKNVHLYLDYVSRLSKMVGGNYDAVFATAAQRAQAFLKTLGLWKEDVVSDTKVA